MQHNQPPPPIDSVSKSNRPSSTTPMQDNPLKAYYNSRVKQIHMKTSPSAIVDMNNNGSATIINMDKKKEGVHSSSATATINMNSNFMPTESTTTATTTTTTNSYSIDNILSKGNDKNSTTAAAATTTKISPFGGQYENVNATTNTNLQEEIGHTMPLLEVSTTPHTGEPINSYQPPLVYYPVPTSNLHQYTTNKDPMDNRNPTVVHSTTTMPLNPNNGSNTPPINGSHQYIIPNLHTFKPPHNNNRNFREITPPSYDGNGHPSTSRLTHMHPIGGNGGGPSHKVASSFHQVQLPPSSATSNTMYAVTNATGGSENEDAADNAIRNTQGVAALNVDSLHENSSLINDSFCLPIDEQFKPMDYGFKRIISRSKYGSEVKVLKKYVSYLTPESVGKTELRSKRDVARFLKAQPDVRTFQLIPEHFNFDNTIFFDADTRTIGKVPRLKKHSRATELIYDRPPHHMTVDSPQQHALQQYIDASANTNVDPQQYTIPNGSGVSDEQQAPLSMANGANYSINNDVSGMNNTQPLPPPPPPPVGSKKRGRPKGATSKTPSKSKKKLKQLDDPTATVAGATPLSMGGGSASSIRGAKLNSTGNGSTSILKMKTKREKSSTKDNNNHNNTNSNNGGANSKYTKLSKQTFDDQLLEQPHQLPLCRCVPIDELVSSVRMTMSHEDICTTLSNLITVYEFVNEFSRLFPLTNRVSVIPPFTNVVHDILSTTTTTTTGENGSGASVLNLVNSPFLALCDCLLETYLSQKLPLPPICYDMKVEFDVSHKFNNINMCTIVRLFIEEHLNSIAHLTYATTLGYNVDLITLVDTLQNSSDTVLQLTPLLKSTFVVFLINLLSRSPCFLNTIDKIMEDFIVTRSVKWNVESFIRKLKRHMASFKPSKSAVVQITDDNSTMTSTHDDNYKQETEEQSPNDNANSNSNVVEDRTIVDVDMDADVNANINNKTEEKIYNNGASAGDHEEEENSNNIDDEDEDMEEDDDDDDDDHNVSKRLPRNNKPSADTAESTTENISDKTLLDALNLNLRAIKLPSTLDKCSELNGVLESKQQVLKEWAFAFFRRLKGLSLGQDRFSRYYSIPYHSSCVFVEHNPRELQLDNFINSVNAGKVEENEVKVSHSPNVGVVNNGVVDVKDDGVVVVVKMEQHHSHHGDVSSSTISPLDNNQDNGVNPAITTDSSTKQLNITNTIANDDVVVNDVNDNNIINGDDEKEEKVKHSGEEQHTNNGFTPLMLIESMDDVNKLTKCLNNLGMRERSLSKYFTRNLKNMSANSLSESKFYKDLSNSSIQVNNPFHVVTPNEIVQPIYGVSVDQIIHLQYSQFFDYIKLGNVFTEKELSLLEVSPDLHGEEFVTTMKSTLITLIQMLDNKGLIVLVKKAKTNSRESKSRYVKSLTEFIESIGGQVGCDLELALTSLQLNVSFEFVVSTTTAAAAATINSMPPSSFYASPFNNKCCFACHLNVNFDRLLTCMYCYISYHSYCQGYYSDDITQIEEDEWRCNHCKSLMCGEAEKCSFNMCRICETSAYDAPPPTATTTEDNECDMESNSSTNDTIVENEEEAIVCDRDQPSPITITPPIRCSLCLCYLHTQCVEVLMGVGPIDANTTTNDIYFCPHCTEACKVSKSIVESGRKRISKKFKMDITEIFHPCHQILNELYRHPCAEDFTKPVDLDQHPLYAQIIKKPIHLQQIDVCLKNLEYKDRDEFVADVRLIFENCKRYNQCDSEIYMAGRKMSYFFETRWSYMMSKLAVDHPVSQ